MVKSYPIQEEMQQVVALVHRYFEHRIRKEKLDALSGIIHDLRVLLQQVVTNFFFHLPAEKAHQFRTTLADRLMGVCGSFHNRCSKEEEHHHRYCVREIMACFEWAEQIKKEIPDDPITQKVLAIDIPILRPFDYGLKKGPVARPHKKP